MEEQGGEKELQTEEEEGRSVKRGDCEKNDRVRKHKKDAEINKYRYTKIIWIKKVFRSTITYF